MKKEVGILTFHDADNLGAVLQSYALQDTISKRYNLSVKIIDYKCDAVEKTKHIGKCHGLKDYIKFLPLSVYYHIKRQSFSKFRKQYLNLTSPIKSDNLKNCDFDFNTVITGSDQVWNPECSGDDYSYFLDFLADEVQKVSYAASIGPHIYDENESKKVTKLLSKFSHISVRETSGREQLTKMGVEKVSVLPDPVTLLSKDEWNKLSTKRLEKQKYVLVYLIMPDVNVTRAAKEYAKKHNCKIINNKESLEFILHNSPSHFLSWVQNAECVFTNSFHGTAFSVIYNKRLAADVALNNGGTNNRVYDFLKSLDALDCIISDENLSGCVPQVSHKIEIMKAEAFKFLDSIFR